MSKDLASSKKICGTCGSEIVDGQAYVAIVEDFEVGKDTTEDLLTKPHQWTTHHSTTQPSRVPVVCKPLKSKDTKQRKNMKKKPCKYCLGSGCDRCKKK